MEYLFFSVVSVCVTAYFGFRSWLSAQPASKKDFEALKAIVDKQAARIDKLNMSGLGRGGT